MSETIDFGSLDVIQIPFKFVDGGKERTFIIKEASCEAHCKFQDARLEAAIYNDKGVRIGQKSLVETIEPLLVSLCVVETTDNGAKAVDLQEVKRWPTRITEALYSKIRKISEIDKEDTEEELLELQKEIAEKLADIRKGSSAKNEQGS